MNISFLQRYRADHEFKYLENVLQSQTEGDGFYTSRVIHQLKQLTGALNIIPMTSCTHALEVAVRLAGIQEGDEVIIPSFTFPSTANAVLMAGGTPVYANVDPITLNINPKSVSSMVTDRTKAVIIVHYGGASCKMKELLELVDKHKLILIEDVAQGIDSYYEDKHLGTFGHFGCISFHGTKNIVSGEGGSLIIRDEAVASKAEIFKDKGTNRKCFIEGKISRYEWVDLGSSNSPSELTMAVLSAQLEAHQEIREKRKVLYFRYYSELKKVEGKDFTLPRYDKKVDHNAHLFFLKFKKSEKAKAFIKFMCSNGIDVRTHYMPLHLSCMGKQFMKIGQDLSEESSLGTTVVRLPIYPDLGLQVQEKVIEKTLEWLK